MPPRTMFSKIHAREIDKHVFNSCRKLILPQNRKIFNSWNPVIAFSSVQEVCDSKALENEGWQARTAFIATFLQNI